MIGNDERLAPFYAVLLESLHTRCRVRVQLHASTGSRTIEGIVLEMTDGRDGKAKLRMGIPMGVGDPVEIRMLLESVTGAERADGQSSPSSRVNAPAVTTPTEGLSGRLQRRATVTVERVERASEEPVPLPLGPPRPRR